MNKRSFAIPVRGVVDDTESFTLLCPAFPNGTLVCYDRISIVDRDNVPDLLTIGFRVGAGEYDVESWIPTIANEVKAAQGRIFVPGSFRVFGRVYGATSGDVFEVTIYGYVTENVN